MSTTNPKSISIKLMLTCIVLVLVLVASPDIVYGDSSNGDESTSVQYIDETGTTVRVDGNGNVTRRIYFPGIGAWLSDVTETRILEPIGLEDGDELWQRWSGADVIDCRTHPNNHCRLWFQYADSCPNLEKLNVKYCYFDNDNCAEYTYIPNAEDPSKPILSWNWGVDQNGVTELVSWLREGGYNDMADLVESLIGEVSAIFQPNRRNELTLGVPAYANSLFGTESRFVAECYD